MNTSVSSIKKWLLDNGFSVQSCFAMDSSLDEISTAPQAAVSLVISSDGIAVAKYLFDTYGVPYVVGVPVGKSFSKKLSADLKRAVSEGVGIRNSEVLSGTDIFCEEEAELEKLFSQHKTVIADPLFRPICKEASFVSLPHVAFSGRCFLKDIPDLIDKDVSKILNL